MKMHKSDEIEVSYLDNGKVVEIKSDSVLTKTVTRSGAKSLISCVTIPNDSDWNKLGEDYVDCIDFCSRVLSNTAIDSSILSYIYVDNGCAVATDGEILAYSKTNEFVDRHYVNSKHVDIIKKINPDYYYTDTTINYYKKDTTILICNTLDKRERYPVIVNESDWTKEELAEREQYKLANLLCKTGESISFESNKKELQNAIKSILSISNRSNGMIRFGSNGKIIVVEGSNSAMSAKQKIIFESDFKKVFKIKGEYLLEILKNFDILSFENKRISASKDGKALLVLVEE